MYLSMLTINGLATKDIFKTLPNAYFISNLHENNLRNYMIILQYDLG